MSALEVLRRITAALDRAGIAYMLTGSFASAHHGAPRSTSDIDIVTYLEQWISELDLKQEWSHAKRIAGISENT
jgi:hypothetical protein